MKRWVLLLSVLAALLICAACGAAKPLPSGASPSVRIQSDAAPDMEPSPDRGGPSQPLEEPQPPGGKDDQNDGQSPADSVSGPKAPDRTADSTQPPSSPAPASVDVDLTPLSSTLVYAEIYHILTSPDEYEGKRIRMRGLFTVYQDPQTDQVYCSVLAQDAAACCALGFDIVMPEQFHYPDDYPPSQSDVCVVGTIQIDRTLESYGIIALRLDDISFDPSGTAGDTPVSAAG